MAKKLTPIEQVTWMLFSVPSGAIFCYTFILAMTQLGFKFPSEVLKASPTIGVSFAFGAWSLYQLKQLGLINTPLRRRTVGITTQVKSLQFARPSLQSLASNQEFEFTGNGLDTPIPESILYRFVRVAWRRQEHATSKDLTLTHLNGRWVKVTVNQVFSQSAYCEKLRPRMIDEDYFGCIHILLVTNLLRGRRQGRGGTLRFPQDRTIDEAKRRWGYSPTPPRITWRSFLPFLPPR